MEETLEPLNCRQLLTFRKALIKMSEVSRFGTQVVSSIRPLAISSFNGLSTRIKLTLLGFSLSAIIVITVSHLCKRRRPRIKKNSLQIEGCRNLRRLRKNSFSEVRPSCISNNEDSDRSKNVVDASWTELSSRQLGLMGLEALECVVGYWEKATKACNPSQTQFNRINTQTETEFSKMLELILQSSYTLQDNATRIFFCENLTSNITTLPVPSMQSEYNQQLINRASFEQDDSFVSALESISDLSDFENVDEGSCDVENDLDRVPSRDASTVHKLYFEILETLKSSSEHIPCRVIRTEFVGCASDDEFLTKMHCLRLAFRDIMETEVFRKWWIVHGRDVLAGIIIKSHRDPKEFLLLYDEMLVYLGDSKNYDKMFEELQTRGVKCIGFYDVVLDYILLDAFGDLESPPSSVLTVLQSKWLSDNFKESALHTAIWSVLKTKRRFIKFKDGFKSKFYDISEILTPILAWGFFGPDKELNNLMNKFKKCVISFIKNMYCFSKCRYTSVEILAQDVMSLATSAMIDMFDALEMKVTPRTQVLLNKFGDPLL